MDSASSSGQLPSGTRLTRRALLKSFAALGVGVPGVATLLAACGGKAGSSTAANSTTTVGNTSSSTTPASKSTSSTSSSSSAAAQSSEGQGTRGGTLHWAFPEQPLTLDEHWSTDSEIADLMWNVYEPLFALDDKFSSIPMLAESHDVSTDGLTHVVHLRKNVPFHNGQEMTADDVLASIKRWATLSGLGGSLISATDTIKQPDNYTLEFHLKQPFGVFEDALSYMYQGCAIYPKSIVDAAGTGQIKKFIGTGPYKLGEMHPGASIQMTRFDQYAALPGKPNGYGGHKYQYLDEIVFDIVPNTSSQIAGMQTGQYHFLGSVLADQVTSLKNNSSVVVRKLPPNAWLPFVLNWKSPLTGKLKIRQAFQAALNSTPIMQAGWGAGYYTLTPSIMFKATNWYTTAGEKYYNINDPDLAKKYLKEAGYDGTPLRFMTYTTSPANYNATVVAKQQLEAVGFKIDLQVYDFSTLVSRRSHPDLWDAFVTGITFRPDPTMVSIMQVCKWPGWWCSPSTEKLVKQLQSVTGFEKRFAIWKEIQEHFYTEIPMINVGSEIPLDVVSSKLKGLSLQTELTPIMWNAWLES